MSIVYQGTTNLNVVGIPNAYVQIVPPNIPIQGVETDIIGIVGTAIGGPTNSPFVGSYQDCLNMFGTPQNSTFDLMTQAMLCNMQGANNFRIVRVTDGTDVAATVNLLDTAPATGAVLTSKYTGTLGNNLRAVISAGTSTITGTLTYKLTVYVLGGLTEVFDNIGGTGATFWTNLVNAVNLGQSGIRGPSNLVVATDSTGTAAPALSSYSLAGGTTGNSGVTSTTLIGADGLTRTGMYALRNSGASLGLLADLTDTTKWSVVDSFSRSTFIYFGLPGAIGQQDTISTAVTNLQGVGIDDPTIFVMLGDWLYFNDPYNNITRLGSPAAFRQGLLANLLPNDSAQNKPLYGIVASQKSQEHKKYSDAELSALNTGRIDVIANPEPAGNIWASRLGINTSSNPYSNRDNYPRMNFYLANSMLGFLGKYIGRPYSVSLVDQANAELNSFYQQLQSSQMIVGYNVKMDTPDKAGTNNPQARIDLGFLQADIQVQLAAIIVNFVVNLDANQGVQISFTTSPRAGLNQ